jgi:hypothetical protein
VLKRQRARKRPAKKREIKEDERKKLEDEKNVMHVPVYIMRLT